MELCDHRGMATFSRSFFRPVLLFLLCLGGVWLSGCSDLEESLAETLNRGNGGYPGSFDPLLAEDVQSFRVLGDLYEGLVVADAKGAIAPGVAESWSVSDDGLRWTFKLRSSARWSDGTPVLAQDFVRSIQTLVSDGVDSSYEFLLAPMKHFDAANSGDRSVELGVKALDSSTLVIELEQPTPYWLSVLSMPIAMPTPEGGGAVYNGAYVLSEARPNAEVILERNEEYWDVDAVAIERVVYHSIVNPTTELNQYWAGELQIAVNLPGEEIAALRETHADELMIAPTLGLYYIAFDFAEPPTNLREVREALSMAVDREQLTELLGRGEQPAYGVVPDGIPGYEPARVEWQDLPIATRQARALAVLEATGYSEAQPLALRLVYDSGDIHERVALIVQSMWEDIGAVDVTLDKREWQYFLATRERREEWDAMRFAWVGDYNDPTTFLDLFASGSAQNLPGYSSSAYDELLSAAAQRSGSERAQTLREAETILLQDSPVAPLYFFVSKHLVDPRVGGFHDNATDRHLSKYLTLETNPERQ